MIQGGEGIRKDRKGFTLLEVVIAVTILTFVVLIIGNFFRLGMNAWDKGEQEAVWTQRFRVLSGLFSQQLKSSYPYEMEIDGEKVVLFKGRSDSMLFATALTDPPYGGFKWVRYSHKDGTLYQKEGLLPDKKLLDNISGDEEEVDSYIEEVKFAYLSLDDGEWKDSWDFSDKLPKAVRVKISYFDPFLITLPMAHEKKENAG